MAARFITHDPRFSAILGPEPSFELLVEDDRYPFAHEAGVFFPDTDTLFVTSNRFRDRAPAAAAAEQQQQQQPQQRVQISKVVIGRGGQPSRREEVDSSRIPMGNGGVNYGPDAVLFCAQGSHDLPSGLYTMGATEPHDVQLLVGGFHGRPFNSVNDVVVHSDASIWFTDPPYGYTQGYRSRPRLPTHVFRYDPATKAIRAMAGGLERPNGICFSPDEKTVYITDTAWYRGDGTTDDSRASTIHAFDLTYYHGEPFLTNQRLFALADMGIPDGIKCDMDGNVYSGCGDGVHVWSPGGVLLGKVAVEGGAANFCFGRGGEMFLLNETRLWRAQLGSHVRGALLGI